MIVKMLKVHVASRKGDSDRLLKALRSLGVVHLEPVDPAKAVAEEKTLAGIGDIGRGLGVLEGIEPAGPTPETPPLQAAREAIAIRRRSIELRSRLAALHHQVEQLAVWGDVTLEAFERLRRAGIDVRFFFVPDGAVGQIRAEVVYVTASMPGRRSLVAVIDRAGEHELPEGAEPVGLPPRDRPSLRAEAAEVDRALKADSRRLAELARLAGPMAAERDRLQQQARYTVASRGALAEADLFAIRGWAPTEKTDKLAAGLARAGVDAAVQLSEPAEDDTPPTLVRYPRWAQPIKGLFDILGTVAGYKEFDVSVPFMLALPIFAAMLIGDGGYGAVLLLAPLVFRKRAARILRADFSRLLSLIGGVALVWGLLNASFFGVVLYEPLIPVNMSNTSCDLMMKISFYMAAVHLTAAQIWRGVSFWPSLKGLGPVGWAIFIWGMLGLVKYFILNGPFFDQTAPWPHLDWSVPWPYLFIGGAAVAILFDSPSKNPFKMIGLGLANFPLSMVSAFSDVISYVRLMAVGLASGVLAGSFNELALSTGSWLTAVPVLILGHGLNLGLVLIALFAHGVRLNMLEFSNNLGMQWTGYSYQPFTKADFQENQT